MRISLSSLQWILLLVKYSEGPPVVLQYYETISTNAPLLRQGKKNNKKRIINDTIYASSIFSYSALNSPVGAYASIMSSIKKMGTQYKWK